MSRLLTSLLIGLGIGGLSGAAGAAPLSRYAGPYGLYTLQPPKGWARLPSNPGADVAFAPADHRTVGSSLMAGAMSPKGSLDQELAYAANGKPVERKRRLKLRGAPCVSAVSSNRNAPANFLICHVESRASARPTELTFFMVSASPAKIYPAETKVFWTVADSVRWGRRVEPGRP